MKTLRILAATSLLMAASMASANVIYTFYANGVTENYAQQGVAVFNFSNDGSSLSVTLTNTVVPTAATQSQISGLSFVFSSSPTAMTLLSVVAPQVIDCTNSSSPCPPGAGTSPYGWGTTMNGATATMGAGFDGTSFGYQPYGIVNASYLSIPGGGQLDSPSNNPLLVGPVTFNFSLTGLGFAPEIGGVVFAFGDPIFAPAAVPEPQSLLLVSLGLLAAAWSSRFRRRPV